MFCRYIEWFVSSFWNTSCLLQEKTRPQWNLTFTHCIHRCHRCSLFKNVSTLYIGFRSFQRNIVISFEELNSSEVVYCTSGSDRLKIISCGAGCLCSPSLHGEMLKNVQKKKMDIVIRYKSSGLSQRYYLLHLICQSPGGCGQKQRLRYLAEFLQR